MTPPLPADPLAGVYEELGQQRLSHLVDAFYSQIPTDPILGPMYPPHDLAGAKDRLLTFLIFRCGGPDDYLKQRGHPALRMRHAQFQLNQAARDRWVLLMDQSFSQTALTGSAADRLRDFLSTTATFLINRHH